MWLAGGVPAAVGVWGNRNVRSHRRRYGIFVTWKNPGQLAGHRDSAL